MKFKLPVLFIIAATIVGCTGHESVEKPGDNTSTIGFSTLLTSRATAITTPALLAAAGGFKVWAYSHPGDWSTAIQKNALLNGTSITSDDNGATWTYDSPAEWPENGDNVSFFAYSPPGSATVSTASGTPRISYTVDPQPSQQKDLLFADQLFDQASSTYVPLGRKVNLYFRHALSQICFSACYTGTKAGEVRVTRVTLKNVYSTGDAAITTPADWAVDTEMDDYTLQTGGEGLQNVALSDTPADISTENGMLYLMPQTVSRAIDQIIMEVTFNIDGGELTCTTPLLAPADWLPGKSYKYQIELDDNAIEVIVIDSDITLTPWSKSIALQTLMLTSESDYDDANVDFALSILNRINTPDRTWFGIYGVNDVTHDLTIDIAAAGLNNFSTGQMLLFDFKKTIRYWSKDTNSDPWEVSVINYESQWELMPSVQGLGVDAITGATTPSPSNTMTARGSIILKKR